MTANQINYLKYLEEVRSNKAQEIELNRANVAKETETKRHNIVTSDENQRHNLVTEGETTRSNRAKEVETNRHNLETEKVARDQYQLSDRMFDWTKTREKAVLDESIRHNKESERISRRQADASSAQAQAALSNALTQQSLIPIKEREVSVAEQRVANESKMLPYTVEESKQRATESATRSQNIATQSQKILYDMGSGVYSTQKATNALYDSFFSGLGKTLSLRLFE